MKKNIKLSPLMGILSLIILGVNAEVKAQYCTEGYANPNTYLNSTDPNTIEYDNMVSGFHVSMVRESDGRVMVWGEKMGQNGQHIAPPQELSSTNYGTGSNQLTGGILKFTLAGNLGGHQSAVLTTAGLYIWGTRGNLISADIYNETNGNLKKVAIGTANINNGATKADGLPNGVVPSDVKMMFGTYKGLAIVTCNGQAWILAKHENNMGLTPVVTEYYGDGTTQSTLNDRVWHRVSTAANTPLENVVAVRGNYRAFVALTAQGKMYTWGDNTRLGNNSTAIGRLFATEMSLPANVIPKMIGMTSYIGLEHTYYLLSTDGRLFALGDNNHRQLGDNTIINRNNWIQVSATNTIEGNTYSLNDNIAWISPNEHSSHSSSISVLTTEGKLWTWGNVINSASDFLQSINPTYMHRSIRGTYNADKLNLSDKLEAVEQSDFHTLLIRACTAKIGYLGHRTKGSMSNSTTATGIETEYNFAATSILSVCGNFPPPILTNVIICPGLTYNLTSIVTPSMPIGATGLTWWADADATTPLSNPNAVGLGTYYATFEGIEKKCPAPLTVSYNTTPGACSSYFISNPFVRQLMENADQREAREHFITR